MLRSGLHAREGLDPVRCLVLCSCVRPRRPCRPSRRADGTIAARMLGTHRSADVSHSADSDDPTA